MTNSEIKMTASGAATAAVPADHGHEPHDAPEQPLVQLTEKAAREVQKIIRENNLGEGTCLRVGAKGGGCSGFSYVLDFDRRGKTEFDFQYEWFGVRVLLDKKSAKVMTGVVVDFNDADLLNRGFVFQNPAATGTCGCGTSFSV